MNALAANKLDLEARAAAIRTRERALIEAAKVGRV